MTRLPLLCAAVARVAVLTAVLGAVLVLPGTAHADTVTYADHDGTAEAAVHVDDHVNDRASKFFRVLGGTIATATSATLRVYGRADGCTGSGPTQRISADNTPIADFDPCQVFPTSGFGWATFPLPLSTLDPDWGSHTFRVEHVAVAPLRSAYYAIDIDAPYSGTTAEQWDYGTETRYSGDLMWEFSVDGNAPALATPQWWSGSFGLVTPGTSVTRTVTVTSSGTAPAPAISTVAIAGATDFTVTAETCTGEVLPYGSTCTVTVTFTPVALGTRNATLTVSGGTASVTVALTGSGRSFVPPATTITTADGSTLLPGDAITGTVTDDVGMGFAYVTFTPEVTTVGTVWVQATSSCDTAGTSCTWSVPVTLRAPGRYTVTAYGVDVQGNLETAGPGIDVVIV